MDKLDAQLRRALQAGGAKTAALDVSIRLAPNPRPEDLQQLAAIVDDAMEDGVPVVTGQLSADDVERVSDNDAVLAVRLSRVLKPLPARPTRKTA